MGFGSFVGFLCLGVGFLEFGNFVVFDYAFRLTG